MTSRLRIKHTSTYRYSRPITASYNEARFTPLATDWQVPLESTLSIAAASWQHQFVDYWGTQVRAFEVSHPHDELVLESVSLVEVNGERLPAPMPVSWADMASATVRDRFVEFLTQTPTTMPSREWIKLARQTVGSLAPHDAALALSARVHALMSYQPGTTGVQTTAREAWVARRGVCQDYAHLLVGALRELGIPARYVSGYLHPTVDAPIGEATVGESHAWVEWWAGEWVGHDPTNNLVAGERHVIVGYGRDYTDVPPFKGIVAGNAETEMVVSVEIVRLA